MMKSKLKAFMVWVQYQEQIDENECATWQRHVNIERKTRRQI